MANLEYLKIPQDRIAVLIGKKGQTKNLIEELTQTHLDIDSEEGTVAVSPQENMDDPLSVWKTNNIVTAIGRGFSPETAINLKDDEKYLEVIKIQDYVGKSKKAIARYKGRIIGKEGRTRQIILEMTGTALSVHGKTVSLIGSLEQIKVAKEAVIMILKGSRHKSVYSYLERELQERKMKEFHSLIGLDEKEFKNDLKEEYKEDDEEENFIEL